VGGYSGSHVPLAGDFFDSATSRQREDHRVRVNELLSGLAGVEDSADAVTPHVDVADLKHLLLYDHHVVDLYFLSYFVVCHISIIVDGLIDVNPMSNRD